MKQQIKTKRVIFISNDLLKYGKKEQLLRNGFQCDCGESQALETKFTIWVKCEHCKKNQ